MTVEIVGNNDTGRCACCGGITRTVWGGVIASDATVAVYYVSWTVGRIEHGAKFELIVGPWGEAKSAGDRVTVMVLFRQTPTGPQFMVVDAEPRPTLAGAALRRDQVIGTPLAQRVFDMLDAIWLGDNRIAELQQN